MDEPVAPPARAQGLLLLGVVFLLGLVCGAALLHLGERAFGFPRWRGFGLHARHEGLALERLSEDLKLDADQKRRLGEILHERRERMEKFLEESRAEMRALLRPDQQGLFDGLHGRHPHGRPDREEPVPPAPNQSSDGP